MGQTTRTVALCGLALQVIKWLNAFLDETYSRLALGKPMVALPGVNGNGNGHGGDLHAEVVQESKTTTTIDKSDKSDLTKL